MTTLHERCKAMLDQLRANAMLRQGSPIDDLMAFVIAETGRSADDSLKEGLPLCLYFATDEDRDKFVEVFRDVMPTARTRKLP